MMEARIEGLVVRTVVIRTDMTSPVHPYEYCLLRFKNVLAVLGYPVQGVKYEQSEADT